MRATQVGAVLAAATALAGQPAIAGLTRPSGGPALGEPLGGLWVVLVLAIVGCVVVCVGAILSARLHRRRRETRHPCSLAVRIEPPVGTPVRLVDISRRGARLRMMLPPLPGARIQLRWEDVAIEATVVWSGEVFAGLRFHSTLPKRTMIRMIEASPPRGGRSAASDWATPGLGV